MLRKTMNQEIENARTNPTSTFHLWDMWVLLSACCVAKISERETSQYIPRENAHSDNIGCLISAISQLSTFLFNAADADESELFLTHQKFMKVCF